MEEAAQIVLQRLPFQPLIEKYSLLYYENKIIISLSTNSTFAELKNSEKFSFLQDIHIQFLHLLNGLNAKNRVLREVIIKNTVNNSLLEYSDKNKTKAIYTSPDGLLKENDVTIMTKKEYSETGVATHYTHLTYEEQEIIDYMIRLFKVMTKNGLDYNP